MTITRRDFLSTTVATAIGASLSGFSGISMAAGGYELISPPQNTSDTTQAVSYTHLTLPTTPYV